jgi:nitrite reductase/ring-hydroxylating ferredoxin subunit/Fe-S cluster biogenesis protein NfuA
MSLPQPTPRSRGPSAGDEIAALNDQIARLEGVVAGWDESQQGVVRAYREAIEQINGLALRRLVGALKGDAGARGAMREAATDELVYAVLRRHNIIKASLNERIEAALASVRPTLALHGGDVELVRLDPPMAEVKFSGSCDGCSASALTFHAGVKKAIQEACPEITEVKQAKASGIGAGSGFISPFAPVEGARWLDAGPVEAIPAGGVLAIVIGGEKVLLARAGPAGLVCYQDACAHLGFPLGDGPVEDGILTCPYHGFRYDLASGECLTAPQVQLQPHAARLKGDRVEVRLTR